MNNDVSSVVWPWREHPAGKTESKKAGHSWIAAAVQTCALVAMGFLSHGKHPVLGNILWGLALAVVVVPPVSAALRKFGAWLGKRVGAILTWGLLVPFYYLCFVPMHLIQKLGGRDPLHRKFPTAEPSYWTVRKPVTDLARYRKQF